MVEGSCIIIGALRQSRIDWTGLLGHYDCEGWRVPAKWGAAAHRDSLRMSSHYPHQADRPTAEYQEVCEERLGWLSKGSTCYFVFLAGLEIEPTASSMEGKHCHWGRTSTLKPNSLHGHLWTWVPILSLCNHLPSFSCSFFGMQRALVAVDLTERLIWTPYWSQ